MLAYANNANPPTTVNGQNQFNWGNPSGTGNPSQQGNTLTSFGFAFNYPVTFVTNPFTAPVSPLLSYAPRSS